MANPQHTDETRSRAADLGLTADLADGEDYVLAAVESAWSAEEVVRSVEAWYQV